MNKAEYAVLIKIILSATNKPEHISKILRILVNLVFTHCINFARRSKKSVSELIKMCVYCASDVQRADCGRYVAETNDSLLLIMSAMLGFYESLF